MKTLNTIVGLTFISLLTWSCNQENSTTTENEVTTEIIAEDSDELSLNDGAKWKVNEDMLPHIIGGEELLNSYISTNDTNYVALAEQLKSQNKNLISSCTMTGKSHDALHNWLHPHIQLVNALNEAESIEDAQGIIEELKTSYTTFAIYFE
jgi:rhamnogalacturonyl hydrolase YesR